MSDFSKFRTAVSGFNRTDVVNYIESTSIEHQKALRKLTDERDKLAAENARLQVELAGLQKRLEQAQADNDALSGQVNALAQEGSDLAEQLKKSEEARQELLARPVPQPAEPEEPAPQPEEPPQPEALMALTAREREIAQLAAARLSNREIAEKLFLSEGSVKQYVNQIYSKLFLDGDTRTKRRRLAELLNADTPYTLDPMHFQRSTVQ